MKFISAILFHLLASTAALAAPATMAAGDESWTITNTARACDHTDTTCIWTFGVRNVSATTLCAYNVSALGSTPASKAVGGPLVCGIYNVTSTWSGQFGPDEGFTTLSVVDSARKVLVYPSYTDDQVAMGAKVSPDQSYPVIALP